MKLCRHPNIVTLLDHFENSEYIFIIMELLTGGDLEEYLHKIKFKISENKAASIMFQLASGIKYLHDYGVLHRDLKPENIMLSDNTDKSTIKIMDFGLSKIMGPQERVADGFGTLSFVAPEVLIRQPYNKQIDIWSLGVILYYMLSGTLPFDDENDNEEIIAKMTVFTEVEFPVKYWSKRTEDVIDIIRKCLIKNPEERIKIDEYLQHKWIKSLSK
jgi:serine/threonine protein kinase